MVCSGSPGAAAVGGLVGCEGARAAEVRMGVVDARVEHGNPDPGAVRAAGRREGARARSDVRHGLGEVKLVIAERLHRLDALHGGQVVELVGADPDDQRVGDPADPSELAAAQLADHALDRVLLLADLVCARALASSAKPAAALGGVAAGGLRHGRPGQAHDDVDASVGRHPCARSEIGTLLDGQVADVRRPGDGGLGSDWSRRGGREQACQRRRDERGSTGSHAVGSLLCTGAGSLLSDGHPTKPGAGRIGGIAPGTREPGTSRPSHLAGFARARAIIRP